MPLVTIETTGRTLAVPDNANLREAMLREHVRLYYGTAALFNCGGEAKCRTCAVKVLDGEENLSPRTPFEKAALPAPPPGIRLACQANVRGDCRVDPSVKA
jgi:ferredoxin